MAFTVADLNKILTAVHKALEPQASDSPNPAPSPGGTASSDMPPARTAAVALRNAEAGFLYNGRGVVGAEQSKELKASLSGFLASKRAAGLDADLMTYFYLTQSGGVEPPGPFQSEVDLVPLYSGVTLQSYLDEKWGVTDSGGGPSGGKKPGTPR